MGFPSHGLQQASSSIPLVTTVISGLPFGFSDFLDGNLLETRVEGDFLLGVSPELSTTVATVLRVHYGGQGLFWSCD